MYKHQIEAMKILKYNRKSLTRQQFSTFRGQIKSGDVEGFYRGLRKVVKNEHYSQLQRLSTLQGRRTR